MLLLFSNAGWESAKAFSVAILVIYRVLLYNMSFLEVPDVSCIWSVVTICCVRFHNFSLASWTLARARGKKLCLLDPYTSFKQDAIRWAGT